ncbi:MAG: amino acid racemase [Burkholderiales bacterium]
MNQQLPLIGVLGGMGPMATIDFLTKVRTSTPAVRDQDHLPLLVHCVPQIPDRSSAILHGDDGPYEPLLAGIRVLEQAGAAAIVIPCNTAHHWHSRLSRETRLPILHIAQAVAEMLGRTEHSAQRVGLMGTRGTRTAKLYDGIVGGHVSALVLPSDAAQEAIDRAIAFVKSGEVDSATRAAAEAAALLVDEQGADRLLLACTELPLALSTSAYGDRCIDATLALAQACVAFSVAHASGGVPRLTALGR